MKCTNCGCEIIFDGNVGICQTCGTKHKLDDIFENTDVCLCYTEYDNAGRRTKDSIIAQEVYNKLENKKINVFYERISASNCLTDELESLRQVAINNASIIIVIGSNKKNFEALTKKYGECFEKKRVIPFLIDINPVDIPTSLNKLQAVDYEKIGWEKDLISVVLSILDRNDEVNIEEIHLRSKKKKHFFVLTCIAVCILILGLLIAFFFKKQNAQTTKPQSVTKLQMYEDAAELASQGMLLEAAEIYSQILDFKDSRQLLDSVYTKYYSDYSGTYLTDDKKVMLSLDIKNNTSVEILYRHNKDGDRKYYSATTTADTKTIEFDGIGKIELLDKKIKFSLTYPNDPSLNISLEFTFEQKGNLIDYDSGVRDELLSFLKSDGETYVDDGTCYFWGESLSTVIELGYNLSNDKYDESIINSVLEMDYSTKNNYKSNVVGEILTPNGTVSYYDYENLKNYYNVSYYDYQYNEENDIIFEFFANSNYTQVHSVLSIFGRAYLLTPDKIGKKPTDFTENGIVYSYVGAGEILQNDDWVNITAYNPYYLKEYNKKMQLIEKINSTDFSNEESVMALNEYDLTERDFMNSNYKLEFDHYTNNTYRYRVYAITGTDYQVIFDSLGAKGEIVRKDEEIKPDITTNY